MRCRNCGARIDDEFEAIARKACPNCGAPLSESPMKR